MKNLKWLLLALFSISTCTTSLLAQRISIRGHGSLHKKQRSINLAYIIHSGFISGYQNRYGDNLKPPTNVYHRMTA